MILKERPAGLSYALYATDGVGKPPAGYINRSNTDVEATGTSVLPPGQPRPGVALLALGGTWATTPLLPRSATG